MGHVLFSPSVLERRFACPGSAAAEKDLPDRSSRDAQEGTAAHALAHACILEDRPPSSFLGETIEGFEVTEEMVGAVQAYLDALDDEVEELGGDLRSEVEVDYSWWMPDGEPGKGTSDAVVLSDRLLSVHDYKHGRGVKVFAERNKQMLAYALGSHFQYGSAYAYDRVRLTIHQPRLGHHDSWELSLEELEAWGEELRTAVKIGRDPLAPRIPGESHCRFCKAAGSCPALARYNLETIVGEFEDLTTLPAPRAPATFKGFELAAVLEHVDMIESWLKAVREEALVQLNAGSEVPGWKLVEGRKGNREWQDPGVVMQTMKAMRLRQDEMFEMKLISPAVAEKMMKEQPRRWSKLAPLITQAPGKPTLAKATDKRPAITPVVNDFTDVSQTAAMSAGEHPWQR